MAIPPPEIFEQMSTWLTSENREHFFEQHRQRQGPIVEKLKAADLWSAMSSSERAFVLATPDQIGVQMLRNVSWLMEAEECLLWALGQIDELPPYDTQSDVEHLKRLPSDDIVASIQSAKLREAKVVSKARDVAELWHWRSRTRQLQESGQAVELPNDLTLVDVIRMAAEKAAGDGLFEGAIEGDFPARGRSYAQLTADEWSEVKSITMERHKALNWLCGYAPANKWEDTPTDT
jgi:hypothetical protein